MSAISKEQVSQRLGKPTLTTADAIAQSMSIGPVFSAISLGALIAGAAGRGSTFVTILGAIAALCTGWVLSVYARKYAGAGAAYEYLRRAGGQGVGIFSAFMYWIGILCLGITGIYVIFGIIASGALEGNFGIKLPWYVYSVLALILITVANYVGVKTTTRVQLTLTVVSVIPFLIVALAVLAKGGAHGHDLSVFAPSTDGSVFGGLLLALSLFVGFEAAAALGEETAQPFKSIPRAIVGTVIISALFYVLIVYTSTIGFGVDKIADWAKDPSPMSTLAAQYGLGWIGPILDIALLLDVLAVASTTMISITRIWYALSRHGILPKALTNVSSTDTPIIGILCAALVGLLFIVIVALSGGDPLQIFTISTNTGILLVNIVFALLAAFVFKLIAPAERKWWHYLATLVAFIIPFLAAYGVLTAPDALVWPNNIVLIGTAVAAVIGLIMAVLNRGKAQELV